MANNVRSIKRASARDEVAKAVAKVAKDEVEKLVQEVTEPQQLTVEQAIALAPVTEIPTGLAIQLRDSFANPAALDTLTVRAAADAARTLNAHIVSAVETAKKNAQAAPAQ